MPPVNAPWNKYEAALLVEACNGIANGVVSMKEVVSALSVRFRSAAQRIGLIISDTYRNENGISLQIQAMKYCLTGEDGLKNPSKLFEQTAKLYKENPAEFEQLLSTANKKYPIVHAHQLPLVGSYHIEQLQDDDKVEEPASNYSNASYKFIKNLKVDILNYVIDEHSRGCKSLRILKILNEFSERLYSLEITTSNQLALWIAKNFPNLWVANQYLLLNKSKFQTEDRSVADNLNECISGKLGTIDIGPTIVSSKPKTETNIESNLLFSVLQVYFNKGYRIGSVIERKKFLRLYKELHQVECNIPSEQLDEKVNKLGIHHGSIVYFPELMLNEGTRVELSHYIEDKFASGLNYIYYSSLSKEFRESLLDSQITTEELLKLYLEYYYPNWYYKKDYLCVNGNIKPDIEREVFDYTLNCGCPVTEDDVRKGLFHLPKEKLHQVFSSNANVLISTSRSGERYHIDLLDISDNELKSISSILFKTIADDEYMTWDDLSSYIHNNHADIFVRNSLVSEIGIRNGLKVKLANQFVFNGNVISLTCKDISVERIVGRFIKNKSNFTLQEIQNLISEFGTGICWEEILKSSIRIDDSNFVKQEDVDFDVEGIDCILDNLCGDSDYMPITAIESFSHFPSCRYQWNLFLLENFVAVYSKKFRIVHKDFNRNCVKGAIVRINSKIKCISDIVLDQLLRAPRLYNEMEILEQLKSDGYIARSRFGDINHIIERAAIMRQNIT